MGLNTACVVHFELKNINRSKKFVKMRSYSAMVLSIFLIEDCEGKTKFVPYFSACKISYPRYDIQEYSFPQIKHKPDIFRYSRP